MARLELQVLGSKTAKVPFSSPHITGPPSPLHLSLLVWSWATWPRSSLPEFPVAKVLFLSLSLPCPYWEVTVCSPHLKSGGHALLPEAGGHINHLEFVFMGDLSLPPIYLFIQPFI